MDYKIYNIIYQDNQKERCEFDIYKNTVNSVKDKSYLFEYNPILAIMEKEKELILKALKKHKGKRKDAALDLGISERTLYRKLKEYDIEE